jgi:DUF1680 family protein
VRTIAEVDDYMYSVGSDGLYINLYSGNTLSTNLHEGTLLKLEQTSNYPWSGNIQIQIQNTLPKASNIFFRIPGWCKSYRITINGKTPKKLINHNKGYVGAQAVWKKGDKIELVLDMPVTMLESHPLVEETKNQVAVKRGPIVYCLESADLPQQNVFNVLIPSNIQWKTSAMKIGNANMIALTGQASLLPNQSWNNHLYREVQNNTTPINIKLIPYYAWANRGQTDMTVWIPLQHKY